VEGRFDSYFKDKPSPLVAAKKEPPKTEAETPKADTSKKDDSGKAAETPPTITRVIDRSPESARIILLASNSFLSDEMLDLASSGLGTRYLKPVQLVENAVDWSLEDRGLLAIRGRAHYSRTLDPLDRDSQVVWEYSNYALALLGLLAIWLIRRRMIKRARLRYMALLGTAG